MIISLQIGGHQEHKTMALSPHNIVLQDEQLAKELTSGNTFGWLDKLSGSKFKCLQKWETRWFVLDQNRLKYYQAPDDKDPIRVLDLKECTDCYFDESMGKANCFRMDFPWRVFFFYASTHGDADEWVTKIKKKIEILRKIYR